MNHAAEGFLTWCAVVPWVGGILVADGFTQTLFAISPPYACTLFVEWMLRGGCS